MKYLKRIFTIENGNIQEVIVPDDDRIARGVETFFFPVNSRRALKVFSDKENARHSLSRQTKAAEHGLGPKAYSKQVFKVIFPLGFEKMFGCSSAKRKDLYNMFEDQVCYGYYTQIIKMVNGEKDYTEEEEDKLTEELLKLFPDVSLDDVHYGNVGRINGKLVMVDFGDESAS